MKVVVLLSTYNGEKYLQKQLDSIMAQTGDFELTIIVRDDGSTDKTKEILDKYANKNNLVWYTGTNLRSARSFMDLLYNSGDYDYYAFSDQDDYWKPEKLISGISALQDLNGSGAYYSNAELVDKELKSLGKNVYKSRQSTDIYTVMCSANILGCTMIFNKVLVDIIKSKRIPTVMTMHDSFVARTCLAVGGTLIYDHNAHMLYRQHDNNVLGIKTKFVGKITQRVHDITRAEVITLDKQAEEILSLYSDEMPDINREWFIRIRSYRKNIFSRCSLAMSRKPQYVSKNMEIKMRLAILLGNR